MKNKIKAIFIAITILIQCNFSISYASDETMWKITRYGDTNISDTDFYGQITNDSKYDGDYAFKGRYYVSKATEGNYIELKNSLKENLPSGRYELIFYGKLTGNMPDTSIVSVSGAEYLMKTFESESVVAPSGEEGWKKYSLQFDYEESTQSYVSFQFHSRLHYQWIDCVSLKKIGENKNYIDDGDFENYTPSPDVYDTAPYQALNIIKSPAGSGALALSWINPTSRSLEKVKLYDITDGKETLLTDTISAVSGKMAYHKVVGLEDGEYKYRLEFHFSDVEPVIYYLNASPSNDTEFSIGGWNIRKWKGGTAGFVPAEAKIDTTESKSGNASLKIESNIDGSQSGFASNIYLMLYYSGLGMTAGKTYRISFWSKCKNATGGVNVHMNFSADNPMEKTEGGVFTGTTDWEYNEYIYKSKGNQFFGVNIARLAEAIWLDDFEAYELDEDGNPIDENNNMFKTIGGFENVVTGKVAKLSNVIVEPSARRADISWEISAGEIDGIALYQKMFDNFEYRGALGAETTNLVMTGLVNGNEYTFRLVPYNASGLEGVNKEFTFTVPVPDYEVLEGESNVVRSALGQVEAGNYMITVPVKNTRIDGGLPYEQIIAVYKDDMLVGVYSTEMLVAKTGRKADPTYVETMFTVHETGEYTIKLFGINNRTDLNLYFKPVEY